jgi:hypothetical protein
VDVKGAAERKDRHTIASRVFVLVSDDAVNHKQAEVTKVPGSASHYYFDSMTGNPGEAESILRVGELSHFCPACFAGGNALQNCVAEGIGYGFKDVRITRDNEARTRPGKEVAKLSALRLKRALGFMSARRGGAAGGDYVLVFVSDVAEQGVEARAAQLGSNVGVLQLQDGEVLISGKMRRKHVMVRWLKPATKEMYYEAPVDDCAYEAVPVERIISSPFKMGAKKQSSQSRGGKRSAAGAGAAAASSSLPSPTLLVLPPGVLQAGKAVIRSDKTNFPTDATA